MALRQSSHASHTPLELLQGSPEIRPPRALLGAQQVRRVSGWAEEHIKDPWGVQPLQSDVNKERNCSDYRYWLRG